MKKLLPCLLLMMFSGLFVCAQNTTPDDNTQKKGEKIKALYVAYMTKELSITEYEAQQFWPVHKEYEQEMRSVNQKQMTELEKEESALNIKKKYQARFSKIIGNDRTNDFYRKDGEFRKKLIEQLRKRKMQTTITNRPFRHP